MKPITEIINRQDYDRIVEQLENVAFKGEENCTPEEIEWIHNTAVVVAAYEKANGMTPI